VISFVPSKKPYKPWGDLSTELPNFKTSIAGIRHLVLAALGQIADPVAKCCALDPAARAMGTRTCR
jgi:hypothetical protein